MPMEGLTFLNRNRGGVCGVGGQRGGVWVGMGGEERGKLQSGYNINDHI